MNNPDIIKDEPLREETIEGRNAVIEALRAKRPIEKIYIAKGASDPAFGHIKAKAKANNIAVVETDRRKLDNMSQSRAHQGVVAVAAAQAYSSLKDILKNTQDSDEAPLVVICDELTDPNNLGAVIRTAEIVGAHGVVIPKRRSAGMTAIVAKASAGALAHIPVAKVTNIISTIKELKDAGFWVFGADAEGSVSMYDADFSLPAAIVIGSEGKGMSRLVRENCDFLVNIPMYGKISSLNASAAAAVLLYETVRQRKFK